MPDPNVVPGLTSVLLTDDERKRCAHALELAACILASSRAPGVREHMDLAERLIPNGEVLEFAKALLPND